MDLNDIYAEIKQNAIFENSDDKNIRKYITEDDVRVSDYAPGEDICSHGSCQVSPAILLRGTAYISASDNEKSLLLKNAAPGSMFGIATLYSSSNHFPTRISAKTHCRVLFIRSSALKRFIENDMDATRSFLRIMGDKVVYLNKKISILTAGSAERKLSLFLCENETDGVYKIKASASALADMLGIGRASLYRALEKLESDGFIRKDEKSITLLGRDAMIEKYFGSVGISHKQNI